MEKDIRKEYGEFADKFGLPSFDEINNEAEIETLDEYCFVLRAVRRKLVDKLLFYGRICEMILFAGNSHIANFEAGKFSEDERKEINEVHKRIRYWDRTSIGLDVEVAEDDKNVEYIKDIWKELPELKVRVKKITDKLRESWLEASSEENIEGGYFG